MNGSREFDVLVVGELNIDLILNKIEGFPEMGKEIIAGEMTVTLGSSSAIFASNLSVLGAKVSYLCKVGKDRFADLSAHLRHHHQYHHGEAQPAGNSSNRSDHFHGLLGLSVLNGFQK